ncbi:MAG: hypothetical protein ABIW47_13780 [Ginsengibacter sp.]|jgi:hypothetical protein
MVEIILKNNIDKDKIEALLQFLKSLNIEAMIKNDDLFEERKKADFTISSGLWKDYSIDGNQLRKQSWERNK